MLPITRIQQSHCHKSQQASSVHKLGCGRAREGLMHCLLSLLLLLPFIDETSYRHGTHNRLVGLHNVGV